MSSFLAHLIQLSLVFSMCLALAIYPATMIIAFGRRLLRVVPLAAATISLSVVLMVLGFHFWS